MSKPVGTRDGPHKKAVRPARTAKPGSRLHRLRVVMPVLESDVAVSPIPGGTNRYHGKDWRSAMDAKHLFKGDVEMNVQSICSRCFCARDDWRHK